MFYLICFVTGNGRVFPCPPWCKLFTCKWHSRSEIQMSPWCVCYSTTYSTSEIMCGWAMSYLPAQRQVAEPRLMVWCWTQTLDTWSVDVTLWVRFKPRKFHQQPAPYHCAALAPALCSGRFWLPDHASGVRFLPQSINERIKSKGWIPTRDHKTALSNLSLS